MYLYRYASTAGISRTMYKAVDFTVITINVENENFSLARSVSIHVANNYDSIHVVNTVRG
jgi:hypothetical protein